jgi:hypothetical protein
MAVKTSWLGIKVSHVNKTLKDSPINSALRQFEATEANLAKLERLWSKIVKQTPVGLQFGSDPAYEELVRTYQVILTALPRIDGWRPEKPPTVTETCAIRR